MGPIYNQGKIIYNNGNTDYIAYSYDVIVKSQINYIYDSIDSDEPNDSYIDATWQQPDKYKQVVKIEFIYNETHPITSFAENVFSDEETSFYLSDIPDSMPNLKEIKIGEGFRTFERGYCFKGDEYNGLGNVEKIDLPSTFESVGGYVGFGATTDNFMVDIPTLKVLILRNPVPPKFYDVNGNEMVPENSFKRLGSAVVYVPDAAVENYKSNPVFADLNIQPLSSYQEPGRKTVFPGKVKGKFEINGKEVRKFYINGVEYYNISKVIIVKKNYIEFADPEVKRLCVQNFSSDGIGVTYDDAAAVTDLGGVFSANTAITSFDELQYFTGLQGIGKRAFDNCSKLTSVTIPNGVTTIGERAFAACLGLTSVTIPNGVTTIDSNAFGSCSNLTAITIPNGVTTIGNEAFTFCSNLTSITIPDSVTTIDGGAFSYCSRLASVTIPTGVTRIEASTFRNCSITSITMPDSITFIGNYAFSNCSSLTSIDIPTGVTIISNSAFMNCSSLTSITIPTGITNIYGNAFSGCSSLTSITSLALTAPGITPSSFRDVSSGGKLYVPTNATGYDVWMGTGDYYLGKYNWTLQKKYIEFADSEVKRLCVENWGSDGEITYDQAAAVTDLGGVFSGNTAITSFDELQYFTGLQGIGQNAFYHCSALTSVTIPDNVIRISGGAFSSCQSLMSIDIPTGVTFIGSSAFSTCSNLTSITIPNGVTNISNDTFFSCRALTSVTIPDNVIRISQNAFYNCSALTSITIPTGVTTIEMNTFKGCSALTSITIPSGVTTIGDYAFQDCSGLTSITIPTGVTSIGTQAFRNCSGFASITSLALTAPEIAVNTFRDVSSGGTLYVPSGATGYNVWMKKGASFLGIFYLGNYNWTLSTL